VGKRTEICNMVAARQSEQVLKVTTMLQSLMFSNIQERKTEELLIVLLKMLRPITLGLQI
jgi:hypothetical protein